MGMTHVTIEVANVDDPETTESVRFLVDSGVTYSVVPRETLGRLGIQPLTDQYFNMQNGDVIIRRKGAAIFKYSGRIGGSDVLFGEPGDENILGTLTLTSLGLALDPLRRELRDIPLRLARARA
jgi:predicted aspartyl protease